MNVSAIVEARPNFIKMAPVSRALGKSFTEVIDDTNATLTGALAAVKLHMPVAYSESGLRSYGRNVLVGSDRVREILLSKLSGN
ncbi:MAG TPA: hypothetical protein VGK13_01955 [Methanocellaceae archaeon]|jgi:UDP-N-acetylglucosamine 2-epimerase